VHPWITLWGDARISTYYACIALGLALATQVLAREADREGLPRATVWDLALIVLPGGAIGGRLFLASDDPQTFLRNPAMFFSPSVGWSSFGAFFGVVVAVVLLARARGVDPWRAADVFAPAFPFGLAFGRMGCLAAGCCHGRPADWPTGAPVPWSVRYYGYAPDALWVVPLHPAPVYEAIVALLVFVVVVGARARRLVPGEMFLTLLMAYGFGRFQVEWFRGDLERGFPFDGPLSSAQVTCLVLFVLGAAGFAWRRRTCSPS
jgi:phosphatidylglycerol:prolipoprotein diacylglycerol transferase